MDVAQGHDVGGDGRFIALLGTGGGEGAWNEQPGGGVGFRWRLVRVERTAVILGGSELVSGTQSVVLAGSS